MTFLTCSANEAARQDSASSAEIRPRRTQWSSAGRNREFHRRTVSEKVRFPAIAPSSGVIRRWISAASAWAFSNASIAGFWSSMTVPRISADTGFTRICIAATSFSSSYMQRSGRTMPLAARTEPYSENTLAATGSISVGHLYLTLKKAPALEEVTGGFRSSVMTVVLMRLAF